LKRITDHLITRAKNKLGASKNKTLLLLSEIISFKNNFNPSANGCNNPNIPTTDGPRRPEYLP
jgi:hypothetical protein